MPFVFLLLGNGLVALPAAAERIAGVVVLLCCSAGLAALFAVGDTHWTVYKPNSDWRAATAYLTQEIAAGAVGRPIFTSTPNPRSLSYYEPRIQDVKNLTPPADPANIGTKVGRRLGAQLGALAEATFRDFAAHNAALLQAAAMRVHRSDADPQNLQLAERMRDDVCYLVRDHWHPHVSKDGSVEALLAHPRVTVLEAKHWNGISVYKIRIAG